VFRREIRYTDKIFINLKLKKARKDFSRFSIQHEFMREDGVLCAVLTIDAAWMDTRARKLTVPGLLNTEIMAGAPKTDDFELVEE
jgi:acyl-CoA thioester hydrolase